VPDEHDIISCEDAAAWETWLAAHHQLQKGVWLRIAKKHSGAAARLRNMPSTGPAMPAPTANTRGWLAMATEPIYSCFVVATKEVQRAASAACTRFAEAYRRGSDQVYDPTRVGVLRLAAERGPIRPTDIAAELDVNPSSITRQVKALHALGHLTIAGDPTDGRAYLVQANDQGRAELNAFDDKGLEVFSAVVEDWSEQDLRLLTTLLDRMIDTWAQKAATMRDEVHARRPGVHPDPWWAGS
jgi:DNA-binding MarR family transcriptional regulator